MEPPAFGAGPPGTVRAAPGSAASLYLQPPTGTPPFTYRWSRAGAALDNRFTSSEEAGGVRLTVSTATTGDSGVYMLQASNAAGSDTSRVRLEVSAEETPTGEDPPTFLRRLQDLTVKVGTRTRFLVEIVSSTECKVTWYRNERRLLEAERVSLARDGSLWCADVGAVSVDDAGRWTCTAENDGGRASCSAHLNVLVPKAYKRPEFVEELRALLTEQGTVSLECKVVGVPTPVLRWFKDSREIKAGDVFALTANAEDPTSLGTYTCEAVNCMGRAYSSSKVHVVGRGSRESSVRPTTSDVTPEPPPIFTKELEDHSVKICDSLTLGCHVVVPPWPRSVVWYNKDGKVEPGERYHVLEDGVGGYLLEVSSAEWADEGEWKCVATSAGGRVGITTCYVAMEVPKNYRKPRFMENLQAVLTEEGLVSFECKVVGFPTPVLSWFKDGQELKPGDVYQLTGTNSLGSYCCIARNCMGQASSSAELTVEDIQNQLNEEEKLQLFSKNQAPKFIQGLKSVEAKIDEPFRFTVKVAIPPEPSVLWYRDEQPVDESTRCHLSKEDRVGFHLDIQNLEFLDQAEWKCVAVNDFGHSVTSCFLKLIIPRHYKKPRFLENLQAILSEEGAVNLECKVIGVPQPVLKWYKDGEELKPGDIHRIISGQDGTCCLGTYTCEAQNCMGIAASSASLLGFDDSIKAKAKKVEEQALQRNLSLSTIHEERTSQMYDTPVGDITLDDKGEISFSFDGKEVSVSLYETPDLTEEEALQIVEMYADQLSENVTEHNVVELPPLRFVKETSTSGNLLMEAIIIDVSPDYFASPEEDLRTEADVEDISIADENGPPQLSLDQDVGGEDYLEKTMALLSDEKSDIAAKLSRKKSDSQKSVDDFFSLSRDQSLSEEKRDDDTHVSESDLVSYESARSSAKVKSKSSKPSAIDGQESTEPTKTILFKEEVSNIHKNEILEQSDVAKQPKQALLVAETKQKTKRERRSSRSSRRSSSGSEKSISKPKEELLSLKDIEQLPNKPAVTKDEFITKISNIGDSLTKVITDVQLIERDIILKSELMSSVATASRSLEIISSLISPLSEIHSIADAVKESVNESKEVTSAIFNSLPQSLRNLHQSLTIIEKCIDMESDNKTLVKKTCVAFIETCGAEMQKMISEITSVTAKDYLQTENKVLNEIDSLACEMTSVIKFSADTIQARNLLSDISEIKLEEPSLQEKHLRDTQKAVFEFMSPVNSLMSIVENAESENRIELSKINNNDVLLNDMSASIQDLQMALEQFESLSVTESTSALQKYNTEIIEAVVEPIVKLREAFEQLSTETSTGEDKAMLKEIILSIKKNLADVSSQISPIEIKIGKFDVLQSDNKLNVLQKMAQSLISLENNLTRLENLPEVQTYMNAFHKNLTKVLEIVIESNDAGKYFTLMEICDAINRINTLIKQVDPENAMPLASLSNTLRIIQDHFVKNVFESELNCSIITCIADVLVQIQESINKAEELSLRIDSENIQDLTFSLPNKANVTVIIEHVNKTIAAINTVKAMENTQELKSALTPTLESICPILEELKNNVASIQQSQADQNESITDLSVALITQKLATPLYELNQNIIVLNQILIENIESLKTKSEIISAVAEPLHELHTTLEILQQDVISQYDDNVTPYEVSLNMASAVQNLHSCIIMIQEHAGVDVADEISTLEDISNIKTSADTLPSDRLILPTAEETGVEQSLLPLITEFPISATASAIQSLNEHLIVLQTPEVVDALDTLSEVSDFSSLKSVVLGIEDLFNGMESILHPVPMEAADNLCSLTNLENLAVIAQPMRELQQSLSVLDTTNIPIYEDILDLPTEKVHSIIRSISEFKEELNKCNQAILPAVDVLNNTFEISTKVKTLRDACSNLKDAIDNAKVASDDIISPEIDQLEEVVESLLDITNVSKGIKIDHIKYVVEELFEKVIGVQEEIIQFTSQPSKKLAQEAELIQIIGEVENNIAVLQQYDFVDLSRASDISSCTSPQIALEMESESLALMANIVENAANVLQDYSPETPVADLMIVEDFFKTCKNEFTILRCLITKAITHKKIIRVLEEFKSLQTVINDFKINRIELNLSHDVNGCLETFLLHADDCFENVQKSLEKIVESQLDMLITNPLDKIQAIEVLKAKSDCDPVISEVIDKLQNIVETSKSLTMDIKNIIIQELKQPSKVTVMSEENLVIERIDDFRDFIEIQSKLAKSDAVSNRILYNLSSCINKHQNFKEASSVGKVLILLKCLSECADILQESKTNQTQNIKEFISKEKESTLKDVLTEMLQPLQALQNQLVSIREQVISGVEEDTISFDITSTESLVQTMTELHKEIIQQIESEKSFVDNEDISLIMEVDKEIHTIQDSIKSMENVEVAQVVKELTKPMKEIEKSLHDVLTSEKDIENKQIMSKDINSNIGSLERILERFINIEIDLLDASELFSIDMKESIQLAVDLKSFFNLTDEELNDPKTIETKNEKITLLKEVLSKFDWLNTDSYLEGKSPVEIDKFGQICLTAYQLLVELGTTKSIDIEKYDSNKNEEESTELLQHIDQYIELIEIVEEISAIIKIEDVKETFEIARELKEAIATSQSAMKGDISEDMITESRTEQGRLALKLQTALSALQVQVLDSAQELAPALSADVLQRIAQVTAQLQADLVAVTGVQIAVQAPLSSLEADSCTKTIMETPILETIQPEIVTAKKSESTILEQVEVINDNIPKVEQTAVTTEILENVAAESNQASKSETVAPFTAIIEDKLGFKDSITQLSESLNVEELETVENVAKQLEFVQSISKLEESATYKADSVTDENKVSDRAEITLVKQEINLNFNDMQEKLAQEIELFVSSEEVNNLSIITKFAELKYAVKTAQEIYETITALETATDTGYVIEKNTEVSANLAQELKNAILVLQKVGVEDLQELSPVINKESLIKISELVDNLCSYLNVVIDIHPEINESQEQPIIEIDKTVQTKELVQNREEQSDNFNKSTENMQGNVDQFNNKDMKETIDNVKLLPSVLTDEKLESIDKLSTAVPKTEETKEIVEVENTLNILQAAEKSLKEEGSFEVTENISIEPSVDSKVESVFVEPNKEQTIQTEATAVEITQILESEGNLNEKSSIDGSILKENEQLSKSEIVTKSVIVVECEPHQEQVLIKESDQSQGKVTATALKETETAADILTEQQLLEHIDEFLADDTSEIVREISNITNIDALKESVSIAKELRQCIIAIDNSAAAEETSLLNQSNFAKEVQLTRELQNALSTLHTQVLESAESITSLINPELLQKVSEVITQLQADLATAVESNFYETIQGAEIPVEISQQTAMNQLVTLLQDVNNTINVTTEKTIDDTETLKDTLDEVQTVIIKLKRNYDCAVNDTLNETLDDLECNVRSVQLQINEDSPPELLKEACETLQLLANNMNSTPEVHVSENISINASTQIVLEKCSNETEETLKLLETASKLEPKDNSNLCNIISKLNNLTNCLKSLRQSFLNDADTLIENGIEVIQCLGTLEDNVFELEKDVEAEQTISSDARDSIITAVHAVYGSISNMRSTISSIQKRFMFENYGQPSELLLRSIKNVSMVLAQNEELDKSDWKKLSKSIRNVLNHFEDIKFYINLDKTARIPSDSTFTNIILEELKTNISNVLMPQGMRLGTKILEKVCKTMACIEQKLGLINEKTSLEVKCKIPIFKDIATEVFNVTNKIKVNLQEINQIVVEESLPDLETKLIINEQERASHNEVDEKVDVATEAEKVKDEDQKEASAEVIEIKDKTTNKTMEIKQQNCETVTKETNLKQGEEQQITEIASDEKEELKEQDTASKQTNKHKADKHSEEEKENSQQATDIKKPEVEVTENKTGLKQDEDGNQQASREEQQPIDLIQNEKNENARISFEEEKLHSEVEKVTIAADEQTNTVVQPKQVTELTKKKENDECKKATEEERQKVANAEKEAELKPKEEENYAKMASEEDTHKLDETEIVTDLKLKEENKQNLEAAVFIQKEEDEKPKKAAEEERHKVEPTNKEVELKHDKDDNTSRKSPETEPNKIEEAKIQEDLKNKDEEDSAKKIDEKEQQKMGKAKDKAVLLQTEENENTSVSTKENKENTEKTELKQKGDDNKASIAAEEESIIVEEANKQDDLEQKKEDENAKNPPEGKNYNNTNEKEEPKANQEKDGEIVRLGAEEEKNNAVQAKTEADLKIQEEDEKTRIAAEAEKKKADKAKKEAELKQQEEDEKTTVAGKEEKKKADKAKKEAELKQQEEDEKARIAAEEEKEKADKINKDAELKQQEEDEKANMEVEEEKKSINEAKIEAELKQQKEDEKTRIAAEEEKKKADKAKKETELKQQEKDEKTRVAAEEEKKTDDKANKDAVLKQQEEDEKAKIAAEEEKKTAEKANKDAKLKQQEKDEKAKISAGEEKKKADKANKEGELKQLEDEEKAKITAEKEKKKEDKAKKDAELKQQEEDEKAGIAAEEETKNADKTKKETEQNQKEDEKARIVAEEEKKQANTKKEAELKQKEGDEKAIIAAEEEKKKAKKEAELTQQEENEKAIIAVEAENIIADKPEKDAELKQKEEDEKVRIAAEEEKKIADKAQKDAELKQQEEDEKARITAEKEEKKGSKAKKEAEKKQKGEDEKARIAAEEENKKKEAELKQKEEDEKAIIAAEEEKKKAEKAKKVAELTQQEEEEKAIIAVEEEKIIADKAKKDAELKQKEEDEKVRIAAEEEKKIADKAKKDAELKQQEEDDKARIAAEEEKKIAEKAKKDAELKQKEEDEKARIAAEKEKKIAEKAKKEAEKKQKEEDEKARIAAEEEKKKAEKAKKDAELKQQEEDEKARIAAEEEKKIAEKAKKDAELKQQEKDEKARIAAEEEKKKAEKAKIDAELKQKEEDEKARIAAEKEKKIAEKAKKEAEKKQKEEDEKARIAAEEEKKKAEKAKKEAEKKQKEEDEKARIAAEEEKKIAEKAKKDAELKQQEEDEKARIVAEEEKKIAEKAKKDAELKQQEEDEKARIAAEKEKKKVEKAKKEAEKKQKEEGEKARIAAEEEKKIAEKAKKDAELKQQEEDEKARISAEEEKKIAEKAKKDAELKQQEEDEKARIAAEKEKKKAEKAKKEAEKKQKEEDEKARIAAEEEKKIAEKAKKDAEFKQQEEDEKARIAAEEEKKIAEKAKKDAELKRKEEDEKARIAAEEEKKIAEKAKKDAELKQQEEDEKARIAAEEEKKIAEKAKKDAELKRKEEDEKARIAAEEEKKKAEKAKKDAELKQKEEDEKARITAEKEKKKAEKAKKEAEKKQKEEDEKARIAAEEEKKIVEKAKEDAKLKQKEETEKAKIDAELKQKEEAKKARIAAEEEKKAADKAKKDAELKQQEEDEKARIAAEEENKIAEKAKKDAELKQKEEDEKARIAAEKEKKKAKKEAEKKQKEEDEKARIAAEEEKKKADKAKKDVELKQQEKDENARIAAEEEKNKADKTKKETEQKQKEEDEKARIAAEEEKKKAEKAKKEAELKQKEEDETARIAAEKEKKKANKAKKEAKLKLKDDDGKAKKAAEEEMQKTENLIEEADPNQKEEAEKVIHAAVVVEEKEKSREKFDLKQEEEHENARRPSEEGNQKAEKTKIRAKSKKIDKNGKSKKGSEEEIVKADGDKNKVEGIYFEKETELQQIEHEKTNKAAKEKHDLKLDINENDTFIKSEKNAEAEIILKQSIRAECESGTPENVNNDSPNMKRYFSELNDKFQKENGDKHYIKEYQYEPTPTKNKQDIKEKPRFVDHNLNRDYTMEFARPAAYRERSFDIDRSSEGQIIHDLGKNATIYKAQTIVLDAQLRSSSSPYLDINRSSKSSHRKPEIRQRSKGLSEARSLVSEKKSGILRDSKRKPVFSTYLTDRTAVEGSRVKLTCSVLSSTDPSISWYKNGILLDNKFKYRTKFTDGLITLEVLNAVPSDSAEYSCSVENENGTVSSSANLKVYPSFEASPIPPTFTRSIRDTYHMAENELVLECRIRGQPLPTITWWKDDRPVVSNERYQAYYLADGVCRLAIESPTPEDSGKYTCKAENSVWSDQITHVVTFTGKETRLSPNIATVEKSRFNRQAMESRRPHFTNVLTDYKVAKGGTIGLQVEIRGAPTSVEWLREGRSVTEVYRNAKIFVEQGLYTLALSDVTEKESGMYTCRAWSAQGNVDMNAAITVVQPNELEGKPAIIVGRPEKDILISVGEDVNISFRVQGEPKPKVIFMKGIRDITTSQRVCKMTSDDYVKFTLKRSIISDAGTYCVLARNAYGCDRAFVTVVVRQRASSDHLISDWTYPADEASMSIAERNYKSVPERIPSEPTVVDGGSNWVSLTWPKPDPGVSAPVLAFRVESWLLGKEGGARWVELGITPLNSFDAFNLKQGEEYHFRVTPRNRYGWGESVQTSRPIAIGLAGDTPEFVDILPGQLKVLAGETAHLKCSVKGKPMPEVVWMKNGHEIEEESGRVAIAFNGFDCGLTIESIGIEDEARYSCEATNVHGRSSTYARLAVVTDRMIWEADAKLKRERSADACGEYPPQFTMRLRDRRVQATYPVRLTCQVVGSPAPTLVWYKDGEQVDSDKRHCQSQDEHFHTLEIAPTALEDGGLYEVLARNSSGAVSCRCSLVVDKGIRAYVAPEFCCGLEPLYQLSDGEELRISAVVEAYPSVGVTWYRDGVRLRPSRRAVMTLDRDGQIELALAAVTHRDAGVYMCTASNEVGRASTSGKVEVTGGEAELKKPPPILLSPDVPYSKEPMFIRKPRSSSAREGDTVIIQCEVVGDPKPDVYWLRDFLKPDYYRDATHFRRVGLGPEYRFEIPHAKLDYTGAYSVIARNTHGEAKAVISLQILAKDPTSSDEAHNIRYGEVEVLPRFEKELTDLLSCDGDAVEFECRISGHPAPDVKWFHYHELIRESEDFEWSFEDGSARLKVRQVTAEDEGTYTCEAANCLGKAASSACLVVYPAGEPNTLCQRLRRPAALVSCSSTPRSTPRSTPARSLSRARTPGPDNHRLSSPARQMAPTFYTYPFNKVAEEGDTVTLQCAVKGLPSPWATWDKDGAIISPSSRFTLKEKDDILRILEIEQVTIDDVGVYRITVENEFGRAEASARLEVLSQRGKFYGACGARAYSPSPRRSLTYRSRRPSSPRQD